ncbi:MAG: hypothetical protein WCC95_19385 [Candidatus Sulfotelmatobacter sp.]
MEIKPVGTQPSAKGPPEWFPGMMDAGTASQHVGCLSPSQFSREYSRFFGSAPTKDVARLRQEGRL